MKNITHTICKNDQVRIFPGSVPITYELQYFVSQSRSEHKKEVTPSGHFYQIKRNSMFNIASMLVMGIRLFMLQADEVVSCCFKCK